MTQNTPPSDRKALLAQLLLKKKQAYSYALSYGQQALWVIYKNNPGNSAYNMAWAVELQGNLNSGVLREALQALVDRHAALRTTVDLIDEEPRQTVHPTGTYSWDEQQTLEGSEAQLWAILKIAYEQPFDLTKGPALRATLLQISAQRYILLLTMHHVLGDADSMNILGNELFVLYHAKLTSQGAVLPPLSAGYADFVRTEIAMLESAEGEKLAQYWKEQLNGEIPILNLPIDYPRPPVQNYHGSSVPFCLSANLTQQLNQLAKRQSSTLFTLLLSAFQVLLYRYTGQEESWIGTPSSIDRRQPRFANIIGYLANSIVLRVKIDDARRVSFNDILSKNREVVLQAIAHSAYPFMLVVKKIQPKRDLSYSPLFQAMIDYKEETTRGEVSADLTISRLDFPQMEGQFDLTFHVTKGEQLVCRFYYNSDLFNENTIQRMVGNFTTLLAAIVENPEQPIYQLSLLTAGEIQQLRMWGTKPLSDEQVRSCSLERSIVNSQIYILDSNHQMLPVGVVGELYISAIHAGGFNHSELSNEQFLTIELFGKVERLLKTGNYARWNSVGNLEPLGTIEPKELPKAGMMQGSYVYPRDMTEFRLMRLWEKLLDVSPISVLDDFFAIGGDSLLAIRLIFGIEKEFGILVPLHTLFQNKTLEQLSCVLRKNSLPTAWSPLVCLKSEGEKPPLFFVHASGGSAFDYFEIAILMGTDHPFYAIQPKGTEIGDTFHATIEAMAADYVTAVRSVQKMGPYFLGGWSFGGTVAFEMARILEQEGETISLVIMIDTPEPTANVYKKDDFEFLMDRIPYYYGVTLNELGLQSSSEEQVAYLLKEVKLAGLFTPDIDQAYAYHWFNMYKHHNLIVGTYQPSAPISSRIAFFKPSEKIPFDIQMGNPAQAWKRFTRGGLDARDTPGNHFNMVSPLNTPELVRRLKACINEYIT